jgi:hypothetical protein
LALNFNLYSVNYIWYLNNAEQQYKKRENYSNEEKAKLMAKMIGLSMINKKIEEPETTATETTANKGAEREGSSNDISSSENSQQVKT